MTKKQYLARSSDTELIDLVYSELCRDGSATGGRLESYKSYGGLFGIGRLLGPDHLSWSMYHLHTKEPLEYHSLSISLKAKPTKKYGLFGSVTGTEVTIDIEGENIESKVSSVLEKYDFRSV